MKIGIFGGTFNPPHTGHVKLCKHFADTLNFDKLLIIPTCIPPHKEAQDLASNDDRMQMCKIAFQDIQCCEISDIEMKREGKSYTIDTLEELQKIYPDGEFFFIMGSDMFKCFKKWYRWQDIISICKICAVVREDNEDCKNLYPDLEDRIIFDDIEPFVISSSEIRAKIKNHDDLSDIVPAKVIDYIIEKEIYTFE